MSTLENLPPEKPIEAPVNRLGQFKISALALRSSWKKILPLFAHMVVVRCEFIYASDTLEYTAQSDLFEESISNGIPPEYEIIATKKDDGTTEYAAQKVLMMNFKPASKAN
jgi:hypothetical protein